MQKNEFLQREAMIYHNVYQEILQATDYFCKHNGIDMVMRFSGDPVDVQNPDSVLAPTSTSRSFGIRSRPGHHRRYLAGSEPPGGRSARPGSRLRRRSPSVPFYRS